MILILILIFAFRPLSLSSAHRYGQTSCKRATLAPLLFQKHHDHLLARAGQSIVFSPPRVVGAFSVVPCSSICIGLRGMSSSSRVCQHQPGTGLFSHSAGLLLLSNIRYLMPPPYDMISRPCDCQYSGVSILQHDSRWMFYHGPSDAAISREKKYCSSSDTQNNC